MNFMCVKCGPMTPLQFTIVGSSLQPSIVAFQWRNLVNLVLNSLQEPIVIGSITSRTLISENAPPSFRNSNFISRLAIGSINTCHVLETGHKSRVCRCLG